MTGPFYFPEALAEYDDAVSWYETRQAGLGDALVAAVDEGLALAMEFPQAGSPVLDVSGAADLRSVLVKRFPLKLVYAVRGERLIVVAVFHTSRRPGYWARRLGRVR